MNKETKAALIILGVGIAALALYLFWPQGTVSASKPAASGPGPEEILLPSSPPERYRNLPEVRSYLEDLRRAIASGNGIVALRSDELDAAGRKVQRLLLSDPEFLRGSRLGGKVLHSDMMRIVPAPVAVLGANEREICARHRCYEATRYIFPTNTTVRAIVDADAQKVLSVRTLPDTQPDISLRLRRIAEAIALHAPEIAARWGRIPREKEMSMANVRTSLQDSPCEDSRHLCVAPTFPDHKAKRALWAIVDLSELKLVAAKWAGLGKTATPACVAERTLQNRYIMRNYCQKDHLLKRDGWRLRYHLSGSDGLEIRDLSYRGRTVLRSAKIVDWHVAYEQEGGEKLDTTTTTYIEGRKVEFVRGEHGRFLFGYNDAMGCPMFSTSVVLAFNGPQIRTIRDEHNRSVGFYINQDFRNPKWPMACNYRYENRFEFYKDGSFRVVGANLGRGCGDNAIYRPVMRIDLSPDTENRERFSVYEAGHWQVWKREGAYHSTGDEPLYRGRYLYRITSAQNPRYGYFIEPNRGQFGDASRGDHESIYASRFKEEEGDRDMLTLGSCCNLDRDGPERFIDPPEPIDGKDTVLWYVPRIRNDARAGHEYCWADTVVGADGNLHVKTWPCIVGPRFVPVSSAEPR